MDERESDEQFLERIAAELRAELPARPDFVERVMQSVRGEVLRTGKAPSDIPRRPSLDIPRAPVSDIPRVVTSDIPRKPEGVFVWMLRPRTVRVSPLVAAALAASIAALIAVGRFPLRSSTTTTVASSASVPANPLLSPVTHVIGTRSLQFVLVAPHAKSVALVGDFNDWDAHAAPLREASGGGLWTITVPLTPGRHQYAFLVDGKVWTLDPAAPKAVEDDFGTPNSVVTVGEGQS